MHFNNISATTFFRDSLRDQNFSEKIGQSGESCGKISAMV
jgi:hypothetical protein